MQIQSVDNLITYRAIASKPSNKSAQKETNQDNTKKIVLALVGLATLAGAGVYIYKRHKKPTSSKPSKPTEPPKPPKKTETPKEKPKIVTEKNDNPAQIIGVTEEEAINIIEQFKIYNKKRTRYELYEMVCKSNPNYKPPKINYGLNDSDTAENIEQTYQNLLNKLKKHNISVSFMYDDKLVLETEKNTNLPLLANYLSEFLGDYGRFNEATFYDTLEILDKKLAQCSQESVSRILRQLSEQFPKSSTDKTVEKTLTLIEKYGKPCNLQYYNGGDDAATYLEFFAWKQNIVKEKWIQRLANEGYKFLGNFDELKYLKQRCMLDPDASFKDSESMKTIFKDLFRLLREKNQKSYNT